MNLQAYLDCRLSDAREKRPIKKEVDNRYRALCSSRARSGLEIAHWPEKLRDERK